MKKILSLLIIGFCFLLPGMALAVILTGYGGAAPLTYYVDQSCTTAGTGTSQTCDGADGPFKTISAALTAVTGDQHGNSILVKKATPAPVYREQATIGAYGTAAGQFTFGAYGSGDTPVISGADIITPGTNWGVASGYQTATTQTLNGDVTVGANGRNDRSLLAANVSSYDGTKVRLTFQAHSAQTSVYSGVSIGESTAGHTFDTNAGCTSASTPFACCTGSGTGTCAGPSRVTFDTGSGCSPGSNSVSIAAGGTAVSCEITFSFDKTKRYLIHTYMQVGAYGRYANASAPGWYSDTTTASDQTLSASLASGPSLTANRFIGVNKVEVYSGIANTWQTAWTAGDPGVVFFDGTVGQKKASVAACASARDWYWASNVLYVYGASDPDTLYTSLGIEAGSRSYAVYVNGKDNITVDGIELKGTTSHVVSVVGSSTGIQLKNLTIHDNAVGALAGIYLHTTGGTGGHLFTGNTIYNTGGDGLTLWDIYSASGTPSTLQNNTIYNTGKFGVYHKSNYWIIQNNTVHDVGTVGTANTGILIQCEASDSGTGLHNIVRYNKVYNVKGSDPDASGIQVDHWTSYTDVYYNLVYNCQGQGIVVTRNTYTNVYNNVMYGNNTSGTGTYPGEMVIISVDNLLDNIVVENNIGYAVTSGTYAIYVNTEATGKTLNITNNDWYRASGNWYYWASGAGATLATWNALTGVGTDLNADPLFVSTVTPDFHLQAGSPAINTGVDVGLTSDYEGNAVPYLTKFDIGAYEYSTFPVTGILDTFNRADASPISGTNWVTIDSLPEFDIISNAMQAHPGNGFALNLWNVSYSLPIEEYVTLSALPLETGDLTMAFVGNSDATTAYRLTYTRLSGTDTLVLDDYYDGTGHTLQTINQEFSINDSFGVRYDGSFIKVYYKAAAGSWAQIGSSQAATKYPSGGYPYFYATEEPSFVNFGGGTIP